MNRQPVPLSPDLGLISNKTLTAALSPYRLRKQQAARMLEELLPEEVWREPQPVLSIQGSVDWDPGIHDRYVRGVDSSRIDDPGD